MDDGIVLEGAICSQARDRQHGKGLLCISRFLAWKPEDIGGAQGYWKGLPELLAQHGIHRTASGSLFTASKERPINVESFRSLMGKIGRLNISPPLIIDCHAVPMLMQQSKLESCEYYWMGYNPERELSFRLRCFLLQLIAGKSSSIDNADRYFPPLSLNLIFIKVPSYSWSVAASTLNEILSNHPIVNVHLTVVLL